MDTLIIYYNEYETNFAKTTDRILDFLELDMVVKEEDTPTFHCGKSYRDFYTSEQMVAISKMLKHLAQPETLDLIGQYLV